MEKQLPENWVETTIGGLALKIQYGYTAKSAKSNEGVRYLRITDIQNEKVNWDDVPSCQIDDDKMEAFLLKRNDIVFARTGATVGKSFLIKDIPFKSVFASYLIRLTVIKTIDPTLIKYFFHSNSYWNQISESATGIGQPNFNATKLAALSFPLPPLPEQKRIVAKLDELFGHLEVIKAGLARIPALLADLRQSILTQAVTGKLTEGWKVRSLNELGKWHGGGTPSKKDKKYWFNGVLPWITPKDMKETFLYGSIDMITEDAVKNSSVKKIQKNSILIVTRSGILRRILPVSMNIVETTVNQDLKALTTKEDYDPKFVLYSLIGLEQDIRNSCMKSGTTVESVEFSLLKSYKIKVPGYQEQQEVVRRIESLFAKADAIEARYEVLKAKIENLPQAILAKAFRGELVAQLPGDGDARELLGEIQALRAKKGKK